MWAFFFFYLCTCTNDIASLNCLYFSTGLCNLKPPCYCQTFDRRQHFVPKYSGKAKTYGRQDWGSFIFSSFLVTQSTYNYFIRYYSSKVFNFAFLGVSQSVCISMIHLKAFLYTFPSFVKVQDIVPTHGKLPLQCKYAFCFNKMLFFKKKQTHWCFHKNVCGCVARL